MTTRGGKMLEIKDVDGVTAVFGAQRLGDLIPKWEAIPKEFKDGNTKWNKLFHVWFFEGLEKGAEFKPKAGVDKTKALRHVRAVMGSFEPRHEHKEAAVAYMMSEWFEDVVYEVKRKS